MPVKVLQSLKESKADLEDKYAFARRLSPSAAASATFTEEEVRLWFSIFCIAKDSFESQIVRELMSCKLLLCMCAAAKVGSSNICQGIGTFG